MILSNKMLKIRFLRKQCRSKHPQHLESQVSVEVLAGYEIQGHAGFAEYGQDIVCAGISILAQGILIGLKDILGERVKFCKRAGYLKVEVDPCVAYRDAPKAILRTLELSILSMANEYPEHIDVMYRSSD